MTIWRRSIRFVLLLGVVAALCSCQPPSEPEPPAARGELGTEYIFTPPLAAEEQPPAQTAQAGNTVYTLSDVETGQEACKMERKTVFEERSDMPGKYSYMDYSRLLDLDGTVRTEWMPVNFFPGIDGLVFYQQGNTGYQYDLKTGETKESTIIRLERFKSGRYFAWGTDHVFIGIVDAQLNFTARSGLGLEMAHPLDDKRFFASKFSVSQLETYRYLLDENCNVIMAGWGLYAEEWAGKSYLLRRSVEAFDAPTEIYDAASYKLLYRLDQDHRVCVAGNRALVVPRQYYTTDAVYDLETSEALFRTDYPPIITQYNGEEAMVVVEETITPYTVGEIESYTADHISTVYRTADWSLLFAFEGEIWAVLDHCVFAYADAVFGYVIATDTGEILTEPLNPFWQIVELDGQLCFAVSHDQQLRVYSSAGVLMKSAECGIEFPGLAALSASLGLYTYGDSSNRHFENPGLMDSDLHVLIPPGNYQSYSMALEREKPEQSCVAAYRYDNGTSMVDLYDCFGNIIARDFSSITKIDSNGIHGTRGFSNGYLDWDGLWHTVSKQYPAMGE